MKIEILLEPKDPNDPLDIDPVGKITLISGEGYISEPYVYVDSWLDALNEGAAQIQAADHVEIDLIEERDPLVLTRIDRGIQISYKLKSIIIKDSGEINAAVAEVFDQLPTDRTDWGSVDTKLFIVSE